MIIPPDVQFFISQTRMLDNSVPKKPDRLCTKQISPGTLVKLNKNISTLGWTAEYKRQFLHPIDGHMKSKIWMFVEDYTQQFQELVAHHPHKQDLSVLGLLSDKTIWYIFCTTDDLEVLK